MFVCFTYIISVKLKVFHVLLITWAPLKNILKHFTKIKKLQESKPKNSNDATSERWFFFFFSPRMNYFIIINNVTAVPKEDPIYGILKCQSKCFILPCSSQELIWARKLFCVLSLWWICLFLHPSVHPVPFL